MKRLTLDYFYAFHTSKFCETVVARSPDTDVMVLSVAYEHQFSANLLFLTGTGNKTRLIKIAAISYHFALP